MWLLVLVDSSSLFIYVFMLVFIDIIVLLVDRNVLCICGVGIVVINVCIGIMWLERIIMKNGKNSNMLM